jgi:hypothetical protein
MPTWIYGCLVKWVPCCMLEAHGHHMPSQDPTTSYTVPLDVEGNNPTVSSKKAQPIYHWLQPRKNVSPVGLAGHSGGVTRGLTGCYQQNLKQPHACWLAIQKAVESMGPARFPSQHLLNSDRLDRDSGIRRACIMSGVLLNSVRACRGGCIGDVASSGMGHWAGPPVSNRHQMGEETTETLKVSEIW